MPFYLKLEKGHYVHNKEFQSMKNNRNIKTGQKNDKVPMNNILYFASKYLNGPSKKIYMKLGPSNFILV